MQNLLHKATVIFFLSFSIASCSEINQLNKFCKKNTSTDTVFCQDFENSMTGEYTNKELSNDWNELINLSSSGIKYHGITEKRVAIINNKNNKYMEILYPKEKIGSVDSGATWIMKLPQSYEKLTLEYKIMFKDNFLFSKDKLGGKLPGLSGGQSNSGGLIPTGKDGWSSRIMWGKEGRGLQYLYYPDMKNIQENPNSFPSGNATYWFGNKYFTLSNDFQCISEWPRPEGLELKFKSNIYYTIKQEITMNTINTNGKGNKDGISKVWVDNKLFVNCNNLRYRDTKNFAIDFLFFSTFFGGATIESSAHPFDERIIFDDFLITK